jgi:arylsulfatase A-like enzyme
VKKPRPNVLLLSLDTLRADHLGCYGYPKGTSPHLDRFSGAGVVFTNCRAQAPWTLASHMALFTSMLPSHNGVDSISKVLPERVATLAQLLRDAGYQTAALVNNGQMMKHWGFGRGFDLWREFAVDTPAGSCPNITAEALTWIRDKGTVAPFFLFLHYYDAHDPYDAPEAYRRKLGTTLTGAEARKLCWRHRTPARPLKTADLLADLVAAYDAEIAWLDDELGKLLAAVPANTLVVIFSDHGEAFAEHGWLLHGATLYEEEVRVPLIVRLPEGEPKRKSIDEPVMLLDVAPTILARCGAGLPEQLEGEDLGHLWEGGTFKERLIPAETKAVLDGRYCLSVTQYPLKGIYSLFDGRFELYRLPDERKDLAGADRAAATALLRPLRDWMEGEQFWMIHAAGPGDYEATVELLEETFGLVIPVGLDAERDELPEMLAEGRALRWHVYPGKGTKSLFLQPVPAGASLRLSFKVNGEEKPEMVFLGKAGKHPDRFPVTVAASLDPVSPFIDRPFAAARAGFHVFRHRAPGRRARPARVRPLDAPTLRQLRSLGYVR